MRYVDGLAVDEVMARTDSSGNVDWYLTNQLGSVVELASTTSGALDKIVYDPYGNVVTQTNAANADRFGFAGMEYDSVTGLYYDHARYYNSVVGRFVSQDPKSFSAGDTNLYRYVGNAPTIGTDPTGYLSWEGAKGGAIVGAGIFATGTALVMGIVAALLYHRTRWGGRNWRSLGGHYRLVQWHAWW